MLAGDTKLSLESSSASAISPSEEKLRYSLRHLSKSKL